MCKTVQITVLFLLCIGEGFSQKLDHVQGELLVQFEYGNSAEHCLSKMQSIGLPFEIKQELSQPLGIWLFTFDFSENNEDFLLEEIRRQPEVLNAQFNHYIEMRSTIPNDPLFDQQWYWLNTGQTGGTPNADVDADLAWDITTGGSTFSGEEIVVCVLEGTNRNHPDLQGNLWFNEAEIPDDGVDNDNNGYIDDYEGWNVSTLTDFINPEQHGTSVSGVIGARGDNGILLTGLNWNVKIMHIDFSNTVESEIVAAYTYPLMMRRRYNQSGGTEGALVVATNASWGIDGGDPADYPIWCAVYDTLGLEGIINCVASTNDNADVDIVGDMPGNCSSSHIICATATDANDQRNFAGYGSENVDVAAPGDNMTLLNQNGGPLNDSGTSYSSPLVAGLVALLYSAPCPSIGQRAIADPVGMSGLIHDAIFAGVDVVPNLIGEVKTGGRINANKSLQLLLDKCARCEKPFGLGITDVTDDSGSLFWTSTDSTLSTSLRWRMLGNPDWMEMENITNPYLLDDLNSCTMYEIQLEDSCSDTMSGFTPSLVFETDGCCQAPDNVTVIDINSNSATITWNPVLAAESYSLILFNDTQTYLFPELMTTSIAISALDPCSIYSVQIIVVCAGGTTDISTPISFTTEGCGTCLDAEYCPSESENAIDEWIANVSINTLDNSSLSDDGYGDYTSLSTSLSTWEQYDISLTPGYTNFEFNEWFVVWIDFNQDGEFDGANEEVFNSNSTSTSTVIGNIIIPGTAIAGPTRMRVAMRFNSEPEACDALFNFGEVEDYCVEIVPGIEPECAPPGGLNIPVIGPTFANLQWTENTDALSYEFRIRPLTLPIWTVISTSSTEVTTLNLEFCALHQFQVRSVCIDEKSLWSPSANFMTSCNTSTLEKESGLRGLEVYPNPFSNELGLNFFNEKAGDISFELLNSTGQIIAGLTKKTGVGQQQIQLVYPQDRLAPGLHFLKIETADGVVVRKVVAE